MPLRTLGFPSSARWARDALRRALLGAALALGGAGGAVADVLEDAESGADGWSVYDPTPAGASVVTVFDEALGSTVFETRGDGRANGYRLGGRSAADGWNETAAFHLGFRLSTTEAFTVYALVDTALGWRYLYYNQSNSDALLSSNGRYVHHGLGSRARNGRWYDWRRDLVADLAAAEPDNELLAVNAVLVRGNVRIDDIRLDAAPATSTVLPRPSADVLADAGDGDASVWRLYDATPEGASVAVVDDATRGSAVYEFRGTGRKNGWRIGGLDVLDGWRNNGSAPLSWAMRTDENWNLYARVETTGGLRYLVYTASNSPGLVSANGRYVYVGLGSVTRNGTWQEHARDLAADLAEREPGNELLAVHGVFLRGNLRLDDLRLPGPPDGPGTDPEAPTVYADGGDAPWRIWDPTPEGATIAPVGDGDDAAVALTGTGAMNAFLLGGLSAAEPGWDNRTQTRLTWRMRADTQAAFYARVDTDDGPRWLVYVAGAQDPGPNGNGTVLYFGLGASVEDGAWHEHSRDLSRDLARFEPGNALRAVHGVALRGSAVIDDVALSVPPADDIAPLASLVATPLEGVAPLEIVFDASGSSDEGSGIASMGIDPGDGTGRAYVQDASSATPAPGTPVTHVYAVPGTFEAVLDVIDAAGNVAEATVSVTVEAEAAEPPVAAFTASPDAADPLVFGFDATGSTSDPARELETWAWDFGDGTAVRTLTEATAVHAYAGPGTYTATLTVTDTVGDVGSAELVVSVLADGTADGGTDGSTDGGTDGAATGGDTGGTTDGGAGDGAGDGMGGDSGGDGGTTGGGTEDGAPDAPTIDAARLLAQATFGPTEEAIAEVRAMGPETWIDAQLALPMRSQTERVKAITTNGSKREPRHDVWWKEVIEADDQLRQRVAFALSEIFVVADTGYTLGNAQFGMAAYYDRLLAGAFGRYRDLLEDVTLSPVMGVWLSMLQNAKGDEAGNTRADENFAREVLQLFSIGLHELNPDGTPVLVDGLPVPSFDTDTVENYARVFTGWNFHDARNWSVPLIVTGNDYETDMEPYDDGAYHDTGSKTLLGGVVTPADASAEADLAMALDSIADHPNVAPFISRQLILKLVTSNPTPAYVGRVSAEFARTGGDLGATVKAILLDDEARTGHLDVPDFGKLREPLLRITHLWRAFDVTPGSQAVGGFYNTRSPHPKDLGDTVGQAVLKAPSVFNFFAPDYAPGGAVKEAGRLAPEAGIYTGELVLSTTSRINEHVQYHHDMGGANEKKWSFVQLADERALADDPAALLARLDLLLLSGSMSDGMRTILTDHLAGIAVSDADPERGRSARVRDAITLIMASPEYLVQR